MSVCYDGRVVDDRVAMDTNGPSGCVIADYVIVGVGAGGALMARFLSDQPAFSVLALEAGDNHNADVEISDSTYANVLPTLYHTQYFSDGTTVPQTHDNSRTFDYIGGKLLGGSSAINGMQYVRGTTAVYTAWQDRAGGDPDWGPDAAVATYKALETFLNLADVPDPSLHGTDGLMPIRLAPLPAQSTQTDLVTAITTLTGVPAVVDYNDFAHELCAFPQWQLYQNADKSRANGAINYLGPDVMTADGKGVGNRRLRVLFNTTVLKISFDGITASGVQALHNGQLVTAYARKKVVVCSGIQTPALLQRSGIGPADVLTAAGVSPLVDSPRVGAGYTNQPFVIVTYSAPDVPPVDAQALYTAGAFLTVPPSTTREIQLIGQWMPGTPPLLLIILILLQPQSSGSIRILNRDPLQLPLVDPNYFAASADVDKLFYAVKNVAMALPLPGGYSLVSPAAGSTDDQIRDFILTTVDQTHHFSTSCQMGASIEDGVVDSTGHVFGTRHLMVADATVAPVQNTGNTSALVYFTALTLARKMGLGPR